MCEHESFHLHLREERTPLSDRIVFSVGFDHQSRSTRSNSIEWTILSERGVVDSFSKLSCRIGETQVTPEPQWVDMGVKWRRKQSRGTGTQTLSRFFKV